MGITVYDKVNEIRLVDNYINTAYDIVKLVSYNIASVSLVSDSIVDVSTIKSGLNSEIVQNRAERISVNVIIKGANATVLADYALRKVV